MPQYTTPQYTTPQYTVDRRRAPRYIWAQNVTHGFFAPCSAPTFSGHGSRGGGVNRGPTAPPPPPRVPESAIQNSERTLRYRAGGGVPAQPGALKQPSEPWVSPRSEPDVIRATA